MCLNIVWDQMNHNGNKEPINIKRVILKVILALVVINFGWLIFPHQLAGEVSVYNHLVNGRKRLPFGENPDQSYNLSLYNLDAMFASHEVDNAIKRRYVSCIFSR